METDEREPIPYHLTTEEKKCVLRYQLNMAVFFWYLVKLTCPVYATTHVYTGQVTFSKVQDNRGHV